MRRTVLLIVLMLAVGCQSTAAPPASKESHMAATTLSWPAGVNHCNRGDHIVHLETDRWKVYRVEDFVLLDRLIAVGDDGFIAEQHLVDSRLPAYAGEIHVLLTAFDRAFPSRDDAIRAAEHGDLGTVSESVYRKLADLRDRNTHVVARSRP